MKDKVDLPTAKQLLPFMQVYAFEYAEKMKDDTTFPKVKRPNSRYQDDCDRAAKPFDGSESKSIREKFFSKGPNS